MNNYIDLHRRSKGVVARAKVSSGDHARLSAFKWYLVKRGNFFYGRRVWYVNGKQFSIYLHQEVMGESPRPGLVIDHINRDGLDNRRNNLRWATRSENAHNTERKGVYFNKLQTRFYAFCAVDGKRHSLGGYRTRIEAEQAVVEFRKERHLA